MNPGTNISKEIDELCRAEWLANEWWPKFLYHFTDIKNAVSILKTGAILSRNEALRLKLMGNENASSEVISNTKEELKNYVRLYFRPKTPTQYHNEGFIPEEKRYHGAHCPVPVFFLFDSKEILSMDDVKISNGNIASPNVITGTVADMWGRLTLDEVFHDGPIGANIKSINYHKQAEILIKNKLVFDSLKYICIRSEAELETFKYLLKGYSFPPGIKIIEDTKSNLFYKHNLFIEEVREKDKEISVLFNSKIKRKQILDICVKLFNSDGKLIRKSAKRFYTAQGFKINLSSLNTKRSSSDIIVKIYINSDLAYQNIITPKPQLV